MSKIVCPWCGGKGVFLEQPDPLDKQLNDLPWSKPTDKGYQWCKRQNTEHSLQLAKFVESLRRVPNWTEQGGHVYVVTGQNDGLVGRIPKRRR